MNNGLRTKITPHIRLLGFSVVNDIPKPTGNILWTFDSSDRLEEIHRALEDNYHAVVGTLLGYPGCCIAANRESKLLGAQTFIKAIIAKVGPDPIAVKRALDNNEQVEVPDDADPQANHVPLTDEKFPFVFHIACDACLNSDDSPSAALNEEFGRFAKALDERLYNGILEMKVFDREEHATIHDLVKNGEKHDVIRRRVVEFHKRAESLLSIIVE